VEFMMDEEVPLDNIALRVDPLRTTVPVAGLRHMGREVREVEAALYQDSNASQASKRTSINSNTDEGIAQVKQVFKREIRIDAEHQSSNKPPLPNRNSMRLAPPPYDDSDCPQSVLSPNNLINAYPASPRTSMRLDQSTLDTNISLMSVSSVVREGSTRLKVREDSKINNVFILCTGFECFMMPPNSVKLYALVISVNVSLTPTLPLPTSSVPQGHAEDGVLSEKGSMKRGPQDSSEASGRCLDVYDANGDLLNNDVDETHSSDSEDDEEDMMKDVSGVYSEGSDQRYLATSISRQGSSSSADKISEGGGPVVTGDTEGTFDDQVQCMDLNIEKMNEEGDTDIDTNIALHSLVLTLLLHYMRYVVEEVSITLCTYRLLSFRAA
jgi:hypothetical protein